VHDDFNGRVGQHFAERPGVKAGEQVKDEVATARNGNLDNGDVQPVMVAVVLHLHVHCQGTGPAQISHGGQHG